MPKLQLVGHLCSREGRTVKSLVTYVPAIELESCLSLKRIYPDLEFVYDAAKNATNVKKVREIQEDLKNELLSGAIGVPISLTAVVEGVPKLTTKKGQAILNYDPKSTFVVGNVLTLTAILKILGIKAPLFSSRFSSAEIKKNSVCRQVLAKEDVMLTIVFDNENGISQGQVKELFFKYNSHNSGLHLSQFEKPSKSFPLKPVVDKLVSDLQLGKYGGVSEKSKHVKSAESYLTTEYILFKFLVGAAAGAHTQEVCKISDDVTTPKGDRVADIILTSHIIHIEAFLKAWLEPIFENPSTSRCGFRLSAQIWQALGLTLNYLLAKKASLEQIERAGKIIGSLDYGKRATHWRDCDVMELDSNGRLYKNSANSSREFRAGLARYFVSLVPF